MALTTSSYARAVCSVSTTSIVRRSIVTGTIRSGMVLMAGIRRIARHGIGAGTATIRGIARGTTRGIIRGTIHGTTTAGVGTILIGAGAFHTFTTLIAADPTRHATSLRAVPAAKDKKDRSTSITIKYSSRIMNSIKQRRKKCYQPYY